VWGQKIARFPAPLKAEVVSQVAGVYAAATSEASASLTTFMPPVTVLSGWRMTLCLEEGAFGSVKSWGMPKPVSRALMVRRALSTPSRVRSLEAQAFFRASPKA